MATFFAMFAFLLLTLPMILGMDSAYSQTPAPVQTCVHTCPSELNLHLYLHQFLAGIDHPNSNEQFVIFSNNTFGFGTTLVHDWILTRTTDPSDTIIARVQGTHIQAGTTNGFSWYISQNIVFQNGRFGGSTLQVAGILSKDSVGQWSIVGGTGEFMMARGIINYSIDPISIKGDVVREISIRVIYDASDVSMAHPGATLMTQ